jgi:HlyD family secretion protein
MALLPAPAYQYAVAWNEIPTGGLNVSQFFSNKVVRTIAVGAIIIAVVVVAWGAFGGSGLNAGAQKESPPSTARVVRGSIEETLSATGTVASSQAAVLSFAGSGQVVDIPVEEGQAVQAGQVLARLDSDGVEQQIARARASLDSAEARMAQASVKPSDIELAAAQLALRSAQASLDRLLDGPPESDLEAAKLGVDVAKNQLWAAQAQRDATKGNLMSSQAQIDSAEAQVLSAEVAVEQALVNQRKLTEPPAEADLAMAQSQVAQAQSQLEQLLDMPRAADLAVSRAQVDEAALALAQTEQALEDLWIVAPFDGTVLAVNIAVGEFASPSAPAIVLADTGHLLLEVLVDEHDVAEIDVGNGARLSFEALPKQEVEGTVSWIASAASQTVGGVAYAVDVAFEPGELPVRIGMTTDLEIITAAVDNALLIPNQAITLDREADRYTVTRQNGPGESETVEVSVGLMNGSFTQITAGLSEGDEVQLVDIAAANDGQQPVMPPFPGMRAMGAGR